MTTFLISADTTFTDATVDPSDLFEFQNNRGSTVTLTFDFANFAPNPSYGIQASNGINSVVFNLADNVDLDGITFTNWSSRDSVTINGSGSNDTILWGTTQADLIRGLGGDDLLMARTVGDTLLGGSGNDSLSMITLEGRADGGIGTDHLTLDLSAAPLLAGVALDLSDGGGGRDIGTGLTVAAVERFSGTLSIMEDTFIGGALGDSVDGGLLADRLEGRGGSDTLVGGDGDDALMGGDGRDVLIAGAGWDQLTGGDGADRFVFRGPAEASASPKADVIVDFEPGRDRIDLSRFDSDVGEGIERLYFIGETAPLAGFGTQVGYEHVSGETVVSVYADSGAEIGRIRLAGLFDLRHDHFIL